jgi:hypothetical protein
MSYRACDGGEDLATGMNRGSNGSKTEMNHLLKEKKPLQTTTLVLEHLKGSKSTGYTEEK